MQLQHPHSQRRVLCSFLPFGVGMETAKLGAMVEVFEGLGDWCNAQETRHHLGELFTVAVCAALNGADDLEEIASGAQPSSTGCSGF